MKVAKLRKRHPRALKVYVDAKILNVHDPSLPREAYVGYVVAGSKRRNAAKLDSDEKVESDDAEVRAILYAIQQLKGEYGRLTIVCDHESVVSEATKRIVKNPSRWMAELRETLRTANPAIELEPLKSNPAHGVVTEFVNREKQRR